MSKKGQKDHKDTNLFVTNDDLKEFIHGIHNFMRNNGFGYGKDALETFNFFYGLKLIESKLDNLSLLNENQKNLLDYKKLIDHIEERKKEDWNPGKFIPITTRLDKILDEIDELKKRGGSYELIYKYIFHNIPNRKTSIREEKWYELINKINKIPVGYEKGRVNLSGKVYEYFVGRDKQAISELGAYFTDRHITEKIFDILNIDLDENNNIKTMIDPFGGSGGFTLGYANYLNDKFRDKINWENNVNNIYHFDIAESVVNMTGLEMFAITGFMPESNSYNFCAINSFSNNFINKYDNSKDDKFEYIISNPPYGGDKMSKGAEEIKCDILVNHLKKKIEDNKTSMKEFIEETEITEISNIIKRLDYLIDNDRDKILYKKNYKIFEKILEKHEENEELLNLISSQKKYNEQLCYLNYKIKKHKKEQEAMQVNFNSCSRRLKYFIRNIKIVEEIYDKKENNYIKIESNINTETVNDKEACSLLLLMDLLKENGICCAVLKEGVFFDSSYSKIRNALINNYNVTDVISVPQDAFENTTTKTSIIIFKNNGKTKKVNFSELKVNKCQSNICDSIDKDGKIWEADLKKEFSENKILFDNLLELREAVFFDLNNWNYVSEVKDEIKNVEVTKLCSATYQDISSPTITKNKKGKDVRNYDYSLNYKNYMNYKIVCPEGYELKKLSDICEIEKGFAFKSEEMKSKGIRIIKQTNIIDNSVKLLENDCFVDESEKYDNYILKEKDIILCLVGGINNKMAIFNSKEKMYLNQNMCKLSNFKSNLILIYIHNYLIKNFLKIFENNCNTSLQNSLSKNSLIEIQIPIPKDINLLKHKLEKLYNLHQDILNYIDIIPEKEKKICELIEKLTDEGKKDIDYEEYKLGEICDLIDGYDFYRNEMDDDNRFKEGINLPLIKINDDEINDYVIIHKKYEKFIVNKGDLVIGTKGSCGNIRIVNIDKAYHKHGLLKFSNIKINKNYLYYFVKYKFDKEYIKLNTNVSVLSNMKKENIINTLIYLLKPHVFQKYKLQELFTEVDNLKERLELKRKEQEQELIEFMKPFNEEESTITKSDEEKKNAMHVQEISDEEEEYEEKKKNLEKKSHRKKDNNSKNNSHVQEISDEEEEIEGTNYIKKENIYYTISKDGKKDKPFYIEYEPGKLKKYEKKKKENK